jgi:hypothetical protein
MTISTDYRPGRPEKGDRHLLPAGGEDGRNNTRQKEPVPFSGLDFIYREGIEQKALPVFPQQFTEIFTGLPESIAGKFLSPDSD